MMHKLIILLFTCACLQSRAQINIITTIAGTGVAGYSGDGGPATNAQLKAPYRICKNKSGDIYIADAANARIRKLILSTNLITTVAGNGTWGFSGDGGAAIDAKLSGPQAIAIDTGDNFVICDAINQRIRKVDVSTGTISTIAGNGIAGSAGDGGLAVNAEINQPAGLFVDKLNNIFFTDWANQKVRKIDCATGIITTIAGTGFSGFSGDGGPAINAQLNGPLQVREDVYGNILISDQYNERLRKIDAATGIITTIAGNGTIGYSGDGGSAINAQLNGPDGIFIDQSNNIYFADYGNGVIRKINATSGTIITIAGIGIPGYDGDGGPATAAKLFCSDVLFVSDGGMIIADYENNRVRRVNNSVNVNGLNLPKELALYPNPTKGRFSVQAPAAGALLSIYNAAGQHVYEQVCISKEVNVDVTNQPAGVYMVYVQYGGERYVSKIVRVD